MTDLKPCLKDKVHDHLTFLYHNPVTIDQGIAVSHTIDFLEENGYLRPTPASQEAIREALNNAMKSYQRIVVEEDDGEYEVNLFNVNDEMDWIIGLGKTPYEALCNAALKAQLGE